MYKQIYKDCAKDCDRIKNNLCIDARRLPVLNINGVWEQNNSDFPVFFNTCNINPFGLNCVTSADVNYAVPSCEILDFDTVENPNFTSNDTDYLITSNDNASPSCGCANSCNQCSSCNSKNQSETGMQLNKIDPTEPQCNCNALDNLMDPKYNLKQVVKQIILLEDHLFHENKRCKDCIKKHFLTVEALLEEAITLDNKNELNILIDKVLKEIKKFHDLYDNKSISLSDLAQYLRVIRKPLMIQFCC